MTRPPKPTPGQIIKNFDGSFYGFVLKLDPQYKTVYVKKREHLTVLFSYEYLYFIRLQHYATNDYMLENAP